MVIYLHGVKKGSLHLLPMPIGPEGTIEIALSTQQKTASMRYFIVENERTTRRYLRFIDSTFPIDQSQFMVIDKHGDGINNAYLQPCLDGHDIGLMSEAGCPCVADPGHRYVDRAHQLDVPVVPYTGSNAILMALMSSGMNGQQFEFHGYLPRQQDTLKQKIQFISSQPEKSHIFIERPHGNRQLLKALSTYAPKEWHLLIASGLHTEKSLIKRISIPQLALTDLAFLHKVPTTYVLGLVHDAHTANSRILRSP